LFFLVHGKSLGWAEDYLRAKVFCFFSSEKKILLCLLGALGWFAEL
jgi:hypothetical protein